MIDVYSWPTPNGHKVHIALEEMGLPYRVHGINIREGEQFKPEFLKISPNNRIPAIVDQDGPNGKPIAVFESGAILLYLASKSGKLVPADPSARWACTQWLMWQMGGLGPMMGQANHFRRYSKEKIQYAIDRYTSEANRLTGVLDRRLGEARYTAGDEYSISDIACFPWLRGAEGRGVDLNGYPNVKRWFDEINARPAVQRALQVLADQSAANQAPHTDKSWDILFGNTQFRETLNRPLLETSRKNVGVLAACQGLLFTNNSVLVTVNALAGYALATDKSLATLPVTAYFVGSMITTLPLSFLMKRYGRRAGFTLGACFAIVGALLCGAAVYTHQFWLLCFGVLVLGAYMAAGQYFRFAAADLAPADYKSTAISLVLAGGIIGGFVGPETSKITRELIAGNAFAGPYLSLIVLALLSLLVLRGLDIPPLTEAERKEPGRPLGEIVRQPAFLVAVFSSMVAYGVMNLIMTATPLAMVACSHPFSDAAFVIQWHFVAMFVPSFLTGTLIRRFGLLTIMVTGVALNAACVAVALAGVEVINFWVALVLVGIGWNFMFIGATTLLMETHTPAERAKVQGINDAAIFTMLVVSSLSSGALFTLQGWKVMNLAAVPLLLLAGSGMLWLAAARRSIHRAA